MPGDRFTDKVVLVTGGSSGLGADTSELFLQEGAKVLVTDLEERDILKRLGTKNVYFQKCDISSAQDCENAVKVCVEKFGRLDILFHNGARLNPLANVVDHDVETFEAVIKTNLLGLFYIGRVAIPEMRKHGKGVIVNTASTSGLYGDFGLSSVRIAMGNRVARTTWLPRGV